MSINVLYNDEDDSAYCFPENINITIRVKIDYLQTQIISLNKELINVGKY